MARALVGPLVAIAAALAAFTALVLAGAMTGIDDWAIDHVMPGLHPYSNVGIVTTTSVWRPFALDVPWWEKVLDLYTYPASFLVSGAVTVACCALLARRARDAAAVVWLGAWLGANALELIGKEGLTRPDVRWSNGLRPVHVLPFDHSYPSGHTARAVVLAALLAYVFPRLRAAAATWLLLVPPALVVAGDHTVSDVVGGMLLGLLLVLGAHAIIPEWTRWRTSSGGSSAASSSMQRPSSRTSQAAGSTSPTQS